MSLDALEILPEETEKLSKSPGVKGLTVKDVELPYVFKDKIIFSPGMHNRFTYSDKAILSGYRNTQWNERTLAVYHAHKDEFIQDPRTGVEKAVAAEIDDYAGFISNIRYCNGGIIRGDVNITDLSTAIKMQLGARVGISPRGKNQHRNFMVENMVVENWAVTVNPAQKTTFLNSDSELESEDNSNLEVSGFAMSEEIIGKEVTTMSDEETKKTEGDEPKTGTAEEQLKNAQEQLKALQDEHSKLKSDVEAQRVKLEDDEEDKKKKEDDEDEEMAVKKKEDDEEDEDLKAKEPAVTNEMDEEALKIVNEMDADKLSEWTDLVKKHGVTKAKELYKAKKDTEDKDEQNQKVDELKQEVETLKEEMHANALIPNLKTLQAKAGETGTDKLSARDLDGHVGEFMKMVAGGNF